MRYAFVFQVAAALLVLAVSGPGGMSPAFVTAACMLIGLPTVLGALGTHFDPSIPTPREQMREDAMAATVRRWLNADEDVEELERDLDDLLFPPSPPSWHGVTVERMRAELERTHGGRVEVEPVYVIGQEYPVDYVARTKED